MATNTDVKLWTHYQTENAETFAIGHARQRALFAEISRVVPAGKALEIGFGDGHLLHLLSTKYECYGADISSANIELMQRKLRDVSFRVSDIGGKLPFDDSYFDLFVASEVLEHLDDDALATVVPEILRVLKPGGYAFVTVPARENLQESECFCPNCGYSFHKWGHKQTWTRDRLNQLLSGFSEVRISEEAFTPDGLNTVGKVVAVLRKIVSHFREVSGLTFLAIARK